MSNWFRTVSKDISKIPDCIDFFESELVSARVELSMKGKTLEKNEAELPGIMEYRFRQLQEIEAILEYLNTTLSKKRSDTFKKIFEKSDRALTASVAEKYVNGDQEIYDYMLLVNEFALLRNQYLAITKGLESKGWCMSNIVRLRCAGLDDARID